MQGKGKKEKLRRCAYIVFALMAGILYLSVAMTTTIGFNKFIINIALMTDFDDKNACSDSWSTGNIKTLSLDQDKMLVFNSNNNDHPFTIKSCNYKNEINASIKTQINLIHP